jgi:hypothetical protein
MSYGKAKGRGKTTFIMLRHDIADSIAWKSISTNARCVWLEIMRRYNGKNNGEIALSCREAGILCNISKNTASKAFKDLQEKGFIKIGTASSFDYKMKKSTRWIVTHEALNMNRPTNEWKKLKC